MGDFRDFCALFEDAKEVRGLDDDGGGLRGDRRTQFPEINLAGRGIADLLEINVLVADVSFQHLPVLGMESARQDYLAAPGYPQRHQDRFGRGGRAVVKRGVGDVHPRQLCDQGLELEHRLQGALGDFGLVRSVGGEKFPT